MKRSWMKQVGWLHLPSSWQGGLLFVLALGFCAEVFLAVDRHSHSVSDTFFGVFPYWASCFLLWDWAAKHSRVDSSSR